MPSQFTTTLPDEDQPVLGNGVEDEVSVDREDETTNNGDVRLQIRETGGSSWDSNATGFDEKTVAYDTVETQFAGREDGEEYEVRLRTETEHVEGAWTEPVLIVTLFPGSDNLTATAAGPVAVDLEWDENSDNEEGQLVLREERFADGWGPRKEVADAGPNTDSYTDDPVLPDREYRYLVRAYTDDAEGDSNTATAETDADEEPVGKVPSSGWFARIDPGDRTVEPSIVGDAEWVPKLNELPQAVIPVDNAGRYEREEYDNADVAVWKDGVRLPIDEIVEVDVTSGRRGELTVRGGRQLKRLVSPGYDNTSVTDAAEELIEDTTDYEANVDEADASVAGGVKQQESDSSADWSSALLDAPATEDLYEVEDGELLPRQTTYPVLANDDNTIRGDSGFGDEFADGTIYSFDDTEKNGLQSGMETSVTIDHDIPADEVEVRGLVGFPTEDPDDELGALHHGYKVRVNGEEIFSSAPDADLHDENGPDWEDYTGYGGPDLEAGESVTLELRFDELSEDEDAITWINALALVDARHPPGLGAVSDRDVQVDSLYATVDVETDDVESVEQVIGGRLEATLNDTGGSQALALSNDGGSNYPVSASNSDTVEGDFPDSQNTIRARFTLGPFDGGGGDGWLVGGTDPQAVDAYELFADLDNTPFLINRSFNGDLRDVLTDIAEFGGFVWEVRRDGDEYSVEFTQPGTREGSIPDGVETDFTIEREADEVIEAAEVTGGSAPRNGERFTADTSEDPIDLSRSRVIDGTEQVYDSDSGTVYEYGEDYRTNNREGELITLEDGDLEDGTEYRIDYQYKPFGEYESGAYDGNTETKVVETFPSVTDDLTAEGTALRLVSGNSTPRVTATLKLDNVSPELSLVEALEPANDAFRDRAFEVSESSSEPGGAELRLAAGETVEESVADLRRRLEPVESRS